MRIVGASSSVPRVTAHTANGINACSETTTSRKLRSCESSGKEGV